MSIKKECIGFAKVIGPYMYINSDKDLDRTLGLIEELMMEAEDSLDDPLNFVIDILCDAVKAYEDIHYPWPEDPPNPSEAIRFRRDLDR